jgi:hypothetical protein
MRDTSSIDHASNIRTARRRRHIPRADRRTAGRFAELQVQLFRHDAVALPLRVMRLDFFGQKAQHGVAPGAQVGVINGGGSGHDRVGSMRENPIVGRLSKPRVRQADEALNSATIAPSNLSWPRSRHR